jgi:hypothetical protein
MMSDAEPLVRDDKWKPPKPAPGLLPGQKTPEELLKKIKPEGQFEKDLEDKTKQEKSRADAIIEQKRRRR